MRNRFTLGLTMAARAAAALGERRHNTPRTRWARRGFAGRRDPGRGTGDNRVLYVLDPASLEVKQRVAIGVNPYAAYFAPTARRWRSTTPTGR